MTLQDIVRMPEFFMNPSAEISKAEGEMFFAIANKTYPSVRIIRYPTPVDNLIEKFRKKFCITDENFITSERYNIKDKSFMTMSAMAMVCQNLIVDFTAERTSPLVMVLYSHETDKTLLNEVLDLLKTGIREKTQQARIGMLTVDRGGMYLTNFPVEEHNLDLESHYNDDFGPVHETIIRKLNQNKSKGIVLLHGKPGTGKTTYLRYLASVIKKQMIFIPYEIACHIASPDFLSFMLDHRESVMILEDAEKLLRTREDGDNFNVANLLNISDGLLSDALHVQLICTFNTDINRLDKALLRKGRIIARYEFKPLSVEKSLRLASSLGCPGPISKPMTLAELFNLGDADYSFLKQAVGF